MLRRRPAELGIRAGHSRNSTRRGGLSDTQKKTGGLSDIRRIYRMLALTRFEILLLVSLASLYALFEGIGVGMLAPVMQYIQFGPSAPQSSSAIWQALEGFANAIGLPINLGTLLLLAFIPIILRQFVYFAYSYYTARVQQRAATRLRSEGFSAIAHGDLAWVMREGQGNLTSGLTAQVMRGSTAIFQFVQQISTGLLVTMYVAILMFLSWQLTLLAVASVGLISILVKRSVTRSRRLGHETAERNNEVYTVIGERLGAIRLIKMLGQEDRETKLVTEVVRLLEEVQVRIAISRGIIEVTIDPLQMLSVFAIVYVGVTYFNATLAALGLFLFILLRLNQKVKDFNVGRQLLSANVDSLMAVRDIIARAEASRDIKSGGKTFEGLSDSITFDHVGFSYQEEEGEEPVLRDVNLVIPCGSQIALVGRSGAGKSTLVDLIPRLREATAGHVLIDGTPINEFDLRSLRRGVGFMTQEAVLFNDTIYGNLVYGLEREPTEDEVQRALERSYCLGFIEQLPNGLQTEIGDRGFRLSGGQRQRLSLARVFLEDPAIIILDEPTSALDSESEEYIQRALQKVRHEKTLIVIAHRLSTVQRADEIIVLDRGVIVERGTHSELIEHNGTYRQLFDLQIYK